MFTLRQTLSAALAAASLLSSGAALAEPCDTYLTTELNWVRDAPSGYSRGLGATIVSLTPAADRYMADMQRQHAELTADLLDAVDPADRAALERGVDAIAARLRELIEADLAARAEHEAAGA